MCRSRTLRAERWFSRCAAPSDWTVHRTRRRHPHQGRSRRCGIHNDGAESMRVLSNPLDEFAVK